MVLCIHLLEVNMDAQRALSVFFVGKERLFLFDSDRKNTGKGGYFKTLTASPMR